MLVENCGGDACGSRVFHPRGTGVAVVKRGDKDKSFAAVFGECASTLWLVVYKG